MIKKKKGMKNKSNKKKIKNNKMIIIYYFNAILLKNQSLFPFAGFIKIISYMLKIILMSMYSFFFLYF